MAWRGAAAVLATIAGLAGYLAHPPVSLWPLVFLPAPLLLGAVAIEVADAEASGRTARTYRYGLLAGLVTFLPMLVWLARPAGSLAWVLLSVMQGLWYGTFTLVVRPFVQRPSIAFVAPLAWVGVEAWRGSWPLGGFDWGALSYAHADGSWLLPTARVLGARGVTLVTVLIGAFAFDAVRRSLAEAAGIGGPWLSRLRAGLPKAQPAFLGLAGAVLLGTLITIEPPAATGDAVDVLAVQGNDLEDWGTRSGRAVDEQIATRVHDLTLAEVAANGAPDLTVWPESSVDRDPYAPGNEALASLVASATAAVGGNLLFGVNLQGALPGTFENSSMLVDHAGRRLDRYVKRHLVPFGEYVPFRSLIGDLGPLRQVPRDGVPGEGPQTITAGPVRVAVAICFETLFPELVRGNVREGGAQMILATTNDASFGRSAEPAQHLAQSRLRAVETGRWVVHAALSGSSAFVDPRGNVTQATELFELDTIRAQVPTVSGSTPFLVVGDIVGAVSRVVLLTLVAFTAVLARRRRRDTGQPAAVEPTT
ncbi:MAG TPA: apolipoprotein N-acyltransferase [Nitriliruptorales bacterium]